MGGPVALTMIVRDEEPNLADCLACVRDLVQEMVVVDTGSSDRTREVARQSGARVHDFAWCDDFAAARNEALRHASSPWIFWMDADDRLDAVNRQRLAALFASLDRQPAAYSLKCVSPRDRQSGASSVTEHLRVFPNHPQIRWENRVHEQIHTAAERAGLELRPSDVIVHHVGYLDPVLRAHKAERNLRLLMLQDREQPNNAFVLFNIGLCYRVLGRLADAVSHWRASLLHASPQALFLRKLYELLIDGCYRIGRPEESLALSEQALASFPDAPELLFHDGAMRIERGDLAAGERRMLQVLRVPADDPVTWEEPLLRAKARHNLAVVYRQQGRHAEAESQLRTCLSETPGYTIAWFGLGQIWLDQGRLPDVAEAASRLESVPETAPLGAQLRVRAGVAASSRSTPRS